jgi:hypothetical protein
MHGTHSLEKQVAGIPGECEVPTRRDKVPLPARIAVELKTARDFSCPSVANMRGTVSTEHGQLLQAILDETAIRTQVTCVLDDRNNGARKPAGLLPQLISCSLSINLYGPKELFEEVGTFFQDYDIYLQDPLDCDLNVRYCNPHRLSSIDSSLCPMTYDLKASILEAFETQPTSRHSELLDALDPQEDLPEASQPAEIRTQLERYFELGWLNKSASNFSFKASKASPNLYATKRARMEF